MRAFPITQANRKALAPLVRYWHQLHRWPRRRRWPIKVAVLTLTCAVVLYPKVWLLPTWIGRLRHLDAVLDPNAPALAELEARVRAEAGNDAPPKVLHAAVEHAVYARIPYAFDWDTWGVMDYVPTVDEVFAKGREDCDGLAVVAASLLRRMGHPAWLASDLKHVWVVTPGGELMSPGKGPKTLISDEKGTRASITPGTLANLGRGMTFGIAVFPLGREIIMVGTLCAVLLHPWASWRRRAAGCGLLVSALVLFRLAGASGAALAARPVLAWVGLAAAAGGWLILAVRAGGRRSPEVRPQ